MTIAEKLKCYTIAGRTGLVLFCSRNMMLIEDQCTMLLTPCQRQNSDILKSNVKLLQRYGDVQDLNLTSMDLLLS